VAWLAFPVSRDAFSAMLETLLPSGIATSEHAAIATALTVTPVNEESLRRAVWDYVGVARDRGAVLGQLVATLSDLADASSIAPTSVRQAVMRGMIHWGTEEYFRDPSDAAHGHRAGASVAGVPPYNGQFARSVP
jgi:hypothetical protein